MKKTIIAGTLLLVGTLTGNKALAQLYGQINTGYAFAMGEHGVTYNFSSVNTSSGSSYTTESVKVSFGKGVGFGAGLGYMFTDNFGFEVNADYLSGGKFEAKDISTSQFAPDPSVDTYTMSANMLRVMPAIVIKTGDGALKPYAKFGLVLGFGKIKETDEEVQGNNKEIREFEYSGGLALGFNSSFGVEMGISDKLTLFGEMRYVGLNYAPTKGELTKEEINGVDHISERSVYYREVEFKEKITEDSTSPDETKPDQASKTSVPFSSIGVNVGLKFNF